MTELEERLRAEVTRRQREVEPSVDLPDRILADVRRERRKRQLVTRVIPAGLVAAGVLAVTLVAANRPDRESVKIVPSEHDDTSVSTTSTPSTTGEVTTSTTAQGTSTTTGDRPPTSPGIGPDTPLSRSGIGPIVAGMTLREAAAAAGVTIRPQPSTGPENTCTSAYIDGVGSNVQFLAERTGGPGADPMDSVIRSVSVAVEGRTEEGVAIGDPVATLVEHYGQPTSVHDDWDGPGSQLLVFERDGFAYSALTDAVQIAVLESGDPDWVGVGDPGGCT